jgi:hypothetical protein
MTLNKNDFISELSGIALTEAEALYADDESYAQLCNDCDSDYIDRFTKHTYDQGEL